MWAAQFYPFVHANRWVTSGGLGTMGFGLPAAIGAQIAEPNRQVVAVVGDAGFQMTLEELAVVAELNLPIKIVIVNNGALGMVRQWQELFYEERYSSSLMNWQPDYLKLAEAYGIPSLQIRDDGALAECVGAFLAAPGPGLLECLVAPMENVYPMIAPGHGLHQMVGVKP
nr:thiamine pyrophosphate-dependent enzyme [Alicyclobacillus fastidiosus]